MDTNGKALGPLQVAALKHPQGCRAYLVVDPASKEALVIDAHLDLTWNAAAAIEGEHWRLRWVVDTHTHADHPSASAALAAQFKADRVAHAMGGHAGVSHHPEDGDVLELGDHKITVRHTPGHTPDHLVLLAGGVAFSGDSLFIGAVARADFLGGSAGQLYDSIHNVLLTLPDETILYPGHDYRDRVSSTIGAEREDNPWLLMEDRDKFIAALTASTPPQPANMAALLRFNREGRPIPPAISARDTIHMVNEGGAGTIIDVRTAEELKAAHIPGSRHIVLDELLERADEIRRTPAPRLILCRIGVRAQMAAQTLAAVGISGLSVIDGGIMAYAQAGGEVVGGDLEAATSGGRRQPAGGWRGMCRAAAACHRRLRRDAPAGRGHLATRRIHRFDPPDDAGRMPSMIESLLPLPLGAGMPAGFIVFIVIGVIALIWGVIYAAQARKKRRLALAAWAAQRGLHFTPDEVSSLERRFDAFKVLRQGSNRYGYNVIRGTLKDRDLWAFDYHYETYSTDSKGNRTTHHHHFSAVIVDSALRLTALTVRAEGFFDKMKGVFGFDDIDFESAEFSRKFWVTSPDKRWAYDVLHQETMELLLESPRFALHFDGSHVMAVRGKRFQPADFDHAVTLVHGVLDRIPKDIVKQLRD